MADYHIFTTNRATVPNPLALLAAVRAAVDVTVGIRREIDGTYRAKKNTLWTAPQIAAAQTALDTCAADTPQLQAQQMIDDMPLATKALLLAIIDELNRLRTQPTTTFAAFTPAQAIAAVRAKAGTL